jgi:DNA-directed RNA polymerase specialized sigma24 family protein
LAVASQLAPRLVATQPVHDDAHGVLVVLIERCKAGDTAAWQEIYERYHSGLLRRIRSTLGSRARDENLVEEIAAKVWFALLDKNSRLLRKYRQQAENRFSAYLAGIARNEVLSYLRAERRRQRREVLHVAMGTPREHPQSSPEQMQLAAWSEFVEALTPCERSFLKRCLQSERGHRDTLTAANRWQLCHRIRRKIRLHFTFD